MNTDQRVYLALALAFLLLVGGVFVTSNTGLRPVAQSGGQALPPIVAAGKAAFDSACILCHGADGIGTAMGPPLVHPLYAAGRLDDRAIATAVRNGAERRNWNFGPMPAQPQFNDSQIAQITAYLRHLQRQAGLN